MRLDLEAFVLEPTSSAFLVPNILNHLKLLRLSINSGCATHFGIISHSDIIQQLAVYTTLIKGCRVVNNQ